MEDEKQKTCCVKNEERRQKAKTLRATIFEISDIFELPEPTNSDIYGNLRKTNHHWDFTNCKARIYKATGEIKTFGIKPGQFFHLDLSAGKGGGHYGDHIEIFNSDKKACCVKNLDGTVDELKTKLALNIISHDGSLVPENEQCPRDLSKGSFMPAFCEKNGCEDCLPNV